MKALELLGRLSLNMCIANPMERIAISGTDVYEAIAELEEAMKPKSCDGCIREEEDMQDPHCAFCSRVCNDNYEAKEQL